MRMPDPTDDPYIQDIIRRREAMTSDEWFAMMIANGIIDEKGKVLIRMPYLTMDRHPPKRTPKKKAKKKPGRTPDAA